MTRAALVLAASTIALSVGCKRTPELPTLHEVPAFDAVDQAGQPFRPQDVSGKVWVANFIFTSCPSVCPMLTTQMRNFQRRLGENPLPNTAGMTPA